MAAQINIKQKKQGEEEKRMPADTCKKTIRQKFLDLNCEKKIGFQKLTLFHYTKH